MKYEWKLDVPSNEDLEDGNPGNILVAAALHNRGIPIEKARDMIEFSYEGMDVPLRLINMQKAIETIKHFLDNPNGHIYIFGDYDADGITSTVIAVQCLNHFHAILHPEDTEWCPYHRIPEREEGYGLSKDWCNNLVAFESGNESNVLVITVDNGITKKDAVSILQEHGITVLITDHHTPDFENHMTPDCTCVDPQIDEWRTGAFLAGCGVIFNIMRYFENVYLNGDHTATDEYEYLMAIGTVGDMMRMDYYHGCVVALGLKRMNSSSCPQWLQEIKDCLNIEYVTGKTIGFSIAAFLNACGQAGKASIALNIILEPDMLERDKLIREAFQIYNTVKTETKKEKERAELEIKETGMDQHSVIIYGIQTDLPGIAGKIAYHLTELTNKPAIVYLEKEGDTIKGSARNVNESIPFYNLLKEAQRKGYIVSANGHMFAQGCELIKEQLPQFIEFMDQSIQNLIDTGESTLHFKRELSVDQIITPDDITMQNVKAIEAFPFTNNWKEPSVCILNAALKKVHKSQNNERNVCYTVQNSKGQNVEFWAWNLHPNIYNPEKHTHISLVGTLSRDFRNSHKPMFNITDFKLA